MFMVTWGTHLEILSQRVSDPVIFHFNGYFSAGRKYASECATICAGGSNAMSCPKCSSLPRTCEHEDGSCMSNLVVPQALHHILHQAPPVPKTAKVAQMQGEFAGDVVRMKHGDLCMDCTPPANVLDNAIMHSTCSTWRNKIDPHTKRAEKDWAKLKMVECEAAGLIKSDGSGLRKTVMACNCDKHRQLWSGEAEKGAANKNVGWFVSKGYCEV